MSLKWLIGLLKGNGKKNGTQGLNPCPNCGSDMDGKETDMLVFRPDRTREIVLTDELAGIDLGFGIMLTSMKITEFVPPEANIHELVFCKECLEHVSSLDIERVRLFLEGKGWGEEEILLVVIAIDNLKKGIKLRGYAN